MVRGFRGIVYAYMRVLKKSFTQVPAQNFHKLSALLIQSLHLAVSNERIND